MPIPLDLPLFVIPHPHCPPYAEIPANHPATVDQFRWSENSVPPSAQDTPEAPLTPSLIKKRILKKFAKIFDKNV